MPVHKKGKNIYLLHVDTDSIIYIPILPATMKCIVYLHVISLYESTIQSFYEKKINNVLTFIFGN